MTSLCVVFLGVGISPHRLAGDKNFLLDLAHFLHNSEVQTRFVSIGESSAWTQAQQTGQNDFASIGRAFHREQSHSYTDESGTIVGYHHQHAPLREFLELSATLLRHGSELRRILRPFPHVVVHWCDLSLVAPVIRLVCGEGNRLVCSVLRYVPLGRVLDRVRAIAVGQADLVITGTSKAREFLISDGCPPSRIAVAPWGSRGVDAHAPAQHVCECHPNGPLVRLLWAGFIQQIGEEDFFRATALAKRVVKQRSDLEFTFCLKPESFRQEYLAVEQQHIRVVKGDSRFLGSLEEYDGLFSPVLQSDSVVAPPLTWIEALSAGLPVITTRVQGIDEVLDSGRSGLIFDDYKSLENWFIVETNLQHRLEAMRATAREAFSVRYSMQAVGPRYLGIYRSLFEP